VANPITNISRRDMLADKGLCITGPSHGPATHGVLCRACRLVHRAIASTLEEARRLTDEEVAQRERDRKRCFRCRNNKPREGLTTCEECGKVDAFRAKLRRKQPPAEPQPERSAALPTERDQVKSPTVNVEKRGTLHTCAVCTDYATCHRTKLDADGPEFWVCISCNTKPAEVKNDYRGYDLPAESGDTRMSFTEAYKRTVPERARGKFREPEQWQSFAQMRRDGE
jgi:hypothetical protein